MNQAGLSHNQQSEIQRQVAGFLGRSPAWRQLSAPLQRQIFEDTSKIVETMATAGPQSGGGDPYAMGQAVTAGGAHGAFLGNSGDKVEGKISGNVDKLMKSKENEIGNVIGAGVTQAARMVHEIDFPSFVASLIEGTFHAIVKSSIEQMQAYAEMVQSVSTSLNDFKDKNTTDNQAMDQLVARYPRHLQVTVVDGRPKVTQRDDADSDNLPDFAKDLGLSEAITDLDDEIIEQKLIPAARDDLARGRQQLLATIILMGINRIVVTDGKINAKIKFQFSANEKRQTKASAFDYAKMGNKLTAEGKSEDSYEGGEGNWSGKGGDYEGNWRGPNSYAKGEWKSSVEPDVRVTSQVDMSSQGAIQASGQIMGEVSVNFKSETFPLEKMVDTNQLMQLQNAQGAGRGAPAPSQAPAAQPAQPAPAALAPAPAPAPAPAAATPPAPAAR